MKTLERSSERTQSLVMAVVIVLLAGLVFFHTIPGTWVYDDNLQIVHNPLISDPALVKKALLTDVWAFQTTDGTKTSRYWRPTFVAWMIISERLFSLGEPAYWRASVIFLHQIASLLAFLVARRLGLAPLIAGAVGLVFALHPSRVESVAWVSGATDPLLAVFLLGSLLSVLAAFRRLEDAGRGVGSSVVGFLVGGLVLFALALGCKEAGALFPGLVFMAGLNWIPSKKNPNRRVLDRGSVKRAALVSLLFVMMTAAYLVVRREILGPDPAAGDPKISAFTTNIWSLPSVGLFYVKQTLLPYEIAPFYDLKQVTEPNEANFVMPGVVFLAVSAVLLYAAFGHARSKATTFGLTLFALIIAPAGFVSHFVPDAVVHDRYLYVPLLGMALLVAGVAEYLVRSLNRFQGQVAILCSGIVACALMGPLTQRYAEAWKTAYGMWKWAAESYPNSQMTLHHYALELMNKGENDKAIEVLERALTILPTGNSYLALADCYLEKSDFDEAEKTARLIVDFYRKNRSFPSYYVYAIDILAKVHLMRDDDVFAAVAEYRTALPDAPAAAGRFYDKMAVILLTDAKDRQDPKTYDKLLEVLEEARPRMADQISVESRMVRFRLAQEYARRGRFAEAIGEFEEFLKISTGFEDDQTLMAREAAKTSLPICKKQMEKFGAAAPQEAPQPASQAGDGSGVQEHGDEKP